MVLSASIGLIIHLISSVGSVHIQLNMLGKGKYQKLRLFSCFFTRTLSTISKRKLEFL